MIRKGNRTMKKIYNHICTRGLLVMAGLLVAFCGWGQNDRYENVSITHKTDGGQWYGYSYQRKYDRTNAKYNPNDPSTDTFDDDHPSVDSRYQNTHVYVDTIYVIPGRSVDLIFPSQDTETGADIGFNYPYYQRWYNYEEDSYSSSRDGSLSPMNEGGYVNNRGYVFADGSIVGGRMVYGDNSNNHLWKMHYTAPSNFDEILIACDASRYTDDRWRGYGGNWEEPTLSTRCIFVIKNPNNYIKQEMNAVTPYEEYTFHFPSKRLGGTNTPEQVTLRMNARNYFASGQNGNDAQPLNVTSTTNITLGISELSDDDRVIPFTYTEKNDKETATIEVRNGTYLVARYHLIFDANTQGLVRTTVQNLENEKNQSEGSLYFRTNDYLEDNFITLAEINFDYDKIDVNGQTPDYYPYPINWEYSTYGFYANGDNQIQLSGKPDYPQAAEYAITKLFPTDVGGGSPLEGSVYHLVVDASDKPGTIIKAPFRMPLCSGAMMYVTAWIKNHAWSETDDDASVVFILKGRRTVDGRVLEEEIYRHASGQIPKTNGNFGDWHQVFFSYPNGNEIYDEYLLQIDNNCASTYGGDICLDDIRVFMNPLSIEAETEEPVCKDEVLAKIRLSMNYELACRRVGLEDASDDPLNDNVVQTIMHYCFLDADIYDNTYGEGNNYEAAFNASLVHGTGVYPGEGSMESYGIFSFYNDKSQNTGTGSVAGMDDEGEILTFVSNVGSNITQPDLENLTGYLHSGRRYYILCKKDIISGEELYLQFNKEDNCTIQGEFVVQGSMVIKGDGTGDIDANTPCIGEIPIISAAMVDSNGDPIENVNFDWYFGDEEAFYAEVVTNHEGRTLQDALEAFRHFYPTEHSVSDQMLEEVGDSRTDGSYILYKEDLELIKRLNEDYTAGGEQPKLALVASKDLNIHLMQEKTPVVVVPISVTVETTKTCWDPYAFVLEANGNAPTLKAGYQSYNDDYPNNRFVYIRMGLSQARMLQNGTTTLTIPLRDPLSGNGSSVSLGTVPDDAILYLGGTTDTEYTNLVGNGLSYEIGEITNFNVQSGELNHIVTIKLLEDNNSDSSRKGLDIKEGHTYTINFRFQLSGSATTGSCNIGNLTIPILIVPEYQKWVGGANGNWNADTNWERSTATELRKTESAYETSNGKQTTGAQGFVPLGFCKLTIPQGEQIQLYQPNRGRGNFLQLETNKPEALGEATMDIAYDLVVAYDESYSSINCRSFYTNACGQLHFEPYAEMFHAERMNYYEKAYADYQLTGGRWYTLASPFLGGVVAGDFYTDSDNGVEKQEYFTGITFSSNSYNNGNIANNRFNPSVYQRAWKGSATLQTLNSGTPNVAIAGNWSSLYNDVEELYKPGTGFSLKVQDLPTSNSAVFRLPKMDDTYTYYNYNNGNPTEGSDKSETIDRSNAGKLQSNALTGKTEFTLDLGEAHDETYYLIGNPFMAHLDMEGFFNKNTSFDKAYWVLSDGNQQVTVGNENGLISTGKGQIAPLQSFFVKLGKNEDGTLKVAPTTVTFTADMQVLGETSTDEETTSGQALLITAQTQDGRTSRAAVAYNAMASDDYQSAEDAELFLDSNLGDVPMVYTVAGTMATSINVRTACERVPLGVYGAKDEEVTLRFEGTDLFSGVKLYDAKSGNYTTLTDGREVRVRTNDYGRYYLTGGLSTDNDRIHTGDDISIYSLRPGEIVVTTVGTPLRSVRVYGIEGDLVTQQSLVNQTAYRLNVPRGAIYVVYAEDMDGIIRNVKLRVR